MENEVKENSNNNNESQQTKTTTVEGGKEEEKKAEEKKPAKIKAPLTQEQKEKNKLQAMMGGAKAQAAHYVMGKSGEVITLVEDTYKPEATLYFKNCADCEYVVDSMCTKIMIDSCVNTKIVLNKKIITAVVEVYKCENLYMHINTNVGTLQTDVSKKVTIDVKSTELFKNLIWTSVHDIVLSFQDALEHRVETGFHHMKSTHPNIVEETSQFITRFVDGKLLTEQIIRLENGYPTTAREKKIYDDRQEEAIQRLAKDAGITISKKKPTGPKAKPNEPCYCGSGKKFKKCHGANQ